MTQQGIRVKQGIWDDYSLVVKHKNLLFSLALVAGRLFFPSFPIFPRVPVPSPSSQWEEKGEGSRESI